MLKTVKINEENYKVLCVYAGDLQKQLKEPVSIDRALTFLIRRTKLSDLAGSWDLTDTEAENMMNQLRKGWSTWKIRSV